MALHQVLHLWLQLGNPGICPRGVGRCGSGGAAGLVGGGRSRVGRPLRGVGAACSAAGDGLDLAKIVLDGKKVGIGWSMRPFTSAMRLST